LLLAIVASRKVLWLEARFGCNPKRVSLKVMTDFSDEGKGQRIQSSPLPKFIICTLNGFLRLE
jgi:hypothetical protein